MYDVNLLGGLLVVTQSTTLKQAEGGCSDISRAQCVYRTLYSLNAYIWKGQGHTLFPNILF